MLFTNLFENKESKKPRNKFKKYLTSQKKRYRSSFLILTEAREERDTREKKKGKKIKKYLTRESR
jgi:hypothetical protein